MQVSKLSSQISLDIQLLSMNDLWMVIATHVSVDNASSQIGNNLIPTVILILADIVTLLLTFVTKLRDSFPANVSVTLLAVYSLSAGAAVLLTELNWSEALIVLSMTAVIFMTAAIAGLKSKNLSGKGWKVFMWILVGFLLVGGVAASFIPLHPQLMTAVGISLTVALAISIFMTIDYLRDMALSIQRSLLYYSSHTYYGFKKCYFAYQ
ncbi:unnamed protein product [Heterobilharzia americana]|nr:unnamed protein product [Heterobilharzia americana]